MKGKARAARHCSKDCAMEAKEENLWKIDKDAKKVDPKWLHRGEITYNGIGTTINPGG